MTRVLGLLLLIGLVAGAAMLMRKSKTDDTATGVGATTASDDVLPDSASCQECHPAVYAEWEQSQHAIAFLNPLVRREDMADGFRKKDCVPCHAPRPVFEHGLGKAARVLARETHRVEGVGCLSCHETGAGQASASPTADTAMAGARCRPTYRPELRSTDLCAPCHNQHLTVDEWEASAPELRGDGCLHCHMGPVERRRFDGSVYTGAFHGSLGGNDPKLLRSAATIVTGLETPSGGEPTLKVVVHNDGCAHNLPTDARHRAIDLVIERLDQDGNLLPGIVDFGKGQEGGHARQRFRNPYRDEYGVADTQIPSGESRELSLTADRAAQMRVRLLYKRTPFIDDADATVVFEELVPIAPAGGK